MNKKESLILISISILTNIILFVISHYLMLIDINNIIYDRLQVLIYSILYLIICNILIFTIYSMFYKDNGNITIYTLFGIIDFLVFIILLFSISDLDVIKAKNELFFTFLIRITNSFFICYSIYYANLVKYSS